MAESYITIATDDISCIGCLVLCNSIKQTGTEKCISVLVNPSVSCHLKSVLVKSFDRVFYTNEMNPISDEPNKFSVNGEYERLKCWLLQDFTKCVFLESDVLVVENIDDLFDRMEFSAAPDPRWPDCFDAGVFVFQPSLETYKRLIECYITNTAVNNSFQCLLNMFFCDWSIISMERKIPFIYNCQLNATFYTHTSALVHFGNSIKAARLGNSVLGLMQPDSSKSGENHENWTRLWSKWWKIFNEMVKPAINSDNTLAFKRTGCDYDTELKSQNRESNYFKQEVLCHSQDSPTPNHTFPCRNQESAYHNPESSCPSQICFNTDREEPCQSLTDTSIESPLVGATAADARNVQGIMDQSAMHENLEKDHRLRWERGDIDYMGEDSFANILTKLNEAIVVPSEDNPDVSTEE